MRLTTYIISALALLSGLKAGATTIDTDTVMTTDTTNRTLIIPPALHEGDRIAILSPAGIARPQNVYHALPVLQEMGWEPFLTEHALGRSGTYSGTDRERFADLKNALLDPSVKAILCSRGGYGAVHLLEMLDSLPLRDNAKWIIGFSDISALHALMHKHGIASIHGPMAKHIGSYEGKDEDTRALFAILNGSPVEYHLPTHEYNRHGEAEGTLTGGNLAVLADLIGTPYDMITPGTILFIEDIAEPIYKIERIMYQLKLRGVLAQLGGLIVGQFTDYEPDADHPSMESMIRDMVREYDYPVAFDIPVGHVTHNIPLIESAQVYMCVDTDSVTISQCEPDKTGSE